MKRQLLVLTGLLFMNVLTYGQSISGFDDITLSAESYLNGSDGTTEYANGGAVFPVTYNTTWDFWAAGFATSNVTDNTTAGSGNLYGNITGGGAETTTNFVVVAPETFIALDEEHAGKKVLGTYITNTTYAYFSMLNGDSFAKKFGGETGDDEDWFLLEITGSLEGAPVEDTVKFYLADYRFEDNSQDYILDEWKWVDLLSLGKVDTLRFQLSSSDVGEWGMNTPAFFALDELSINDITSKAVVASDDESIKFWASGAVVERGPLNIMSNPTAVSYGEDINAVGAQDGSLVSLGDGGTATLTFDGVVQNKEGDDIFVFENSFVAGGNMFAELGFVEVSSDGVNFVRFPAKSLTPTQEEVGSFDPVDTSLVYNLAGTAPAGYAVAFDLEDLTGSSGIDIMSISHIRIVDVVGTINETYATYDAFGNVVNDPFPTAFPSGGFDLDAVGVSNLYTVNTAFQEVVASNFTVYPNPSAGHVTIDLKEAAEVSVLDINGVVVYSTYGSESVAIDQLSSGLYFVRTESASGIFTEKLVVR